MEMRKTLSLMNPTKSFLTGLVTVLPIVNTAYLLVLALADDMIYVIFP